MWRIHSRSGFGGWLEIRRLSVCVMALAIGAVLLAPAAAGAAPSIPSSAASGGVAIVDTTSGRYAFPGPTIGFTFTGTFVVGTNVFVGQVSGGTFFASPMPPFELTGSSLGHTFAASCQAQLFTPPVPDLLGPAGVYPPLAVYLQCAASIDGAEPGPLQLVVLLGPGICQGFCDPSLVEIQYTGVFAGANVPDLSAAPTVDGLAAFVRIDDTHAPFPGSLLRLCLTVGDPNNPRCVSV